jgi:xanthine/uracil/vitamin C permease (AzgA family)
MFVFVLLFVAHVIFSQLSCVTRGSSHETPANCFLGMVPYEVALTAVFVEGFVFVGLTVLGIRQWLAR